MAAAAALVVAKIPLDGAELFFRHHPGKLKILVGGHNVVVLARQQLDQIVVGLAGGALIEQGAQPGQKSPAGFRRRIGMVKTVEGSNEAILFMKVSQVAVEQGVVAVKEIKAAGSGHPGGSSHQDGVGLADLVQQNLNIFPVGRRAGGGGVIGHHD